MDAASRFTSALMQREERLVEAQQRVAARQSTLAEIRRARMARRVEDSERRQLKVLDARLAMERDLNARIAHTEEQIQRKAAQVETFQRSRAPAKEGSGGVVASSFTSPRQQSHVKRRTTKAHDGATGLEEPQLKCALCEQQFSILPGVTYLKAVATQRAAFGDESKLRWCERRGLLKLYESASLCVFCCQFFQGRD